MAKTIVSISGTSRPENYTAKAVAIVNKEFEQLGIQVKSFDGRSLALGFPGMPQTPDAKALIEAVRDASGVLIATPEYHGTFSSLTKLVIENLSFPSVLSGKPIALLGVAAGRIGAIKSIEHLRGVCAHVGAFVVPGAVSIAGVQSLFSEEGKCKDPGTEKALRGVAHSLNDFLRDYVCPKFILEETVRKQEKGWTADL